ncbi:hypothetical protein H0H93_007136, partial [Arthromyces matolae]
MDGFVRFIEYFVIERGVPIMLVEAKLGHLIETLEELVKVDETFITASPLLSANIQYQELEDLDEDEIEIIDKPENPSMSVKLCKGYQLPIPDDRSPHLCYPFSLHDHMSLPWDYTVKNGIMVLYARSCPSKVRKGHMSCDACQSLAENSVIQGIVQRIESGIHESTPRPFYTLQHAFELLDRKSAQIDFLRLQGLNQARRLISQAAALADHKRFMVAIGSGSFERVDRLVRIALEQRRGIRGILTLYMAAAKKIYKPKSYSEEDEMRGLLLWRLGGNQIAHIAHLALSLPSLTTLRNRTITIPIIPSNGSPQIDEIRKNVRATLEPVKEILAKERPVHQVLMFDEIATEKRIRWDQKSNLFLGVCREHAHRVSLEFTTEQDMEEVFHAIDDGEIHVAAEATIGALGILSDNHRLYPARGILISGDCKRETGIEHAKIIQTAIDAMNSEKPFTNLRIVSIASDGETRRGSAFVSLTFRYDLSEESPIFPLISPLRFMNILVGKDEVTADKDWKHVHKRLRNLLLRQRGIIVNSIRITPDVIKLHLKSEGHSAEHVHSLFNPDDQQDVKLAFDLLKDIWSLGPVLGEKHSPGFVNARNALHVLGTFLYHIVFPYICVDLTLSEQIEHLSAAAHLGLILYRQAKKAFLPTLLYTDIMIMIKNAIFCIAKAKVDDPDGSFWLMLLGTDRLETLFGILRTMVGSDANLDILQLVQRITGTTEVANILAKYPQWDRGPRRLHLPALTRDAKQLPDATDHIKPSSWRGDVSVKSVSLLTSWRRGRRIIENMSPAFASILAEVDDCRGADILCPFGVLLFDVPLDDDDLDETLEIEDDLTDKSPDLAIPNDRVEVEDAITEEGTDTPSALGQKPFDLSIEVDGKRISKARALSLRSKYHKKPSSTDRLKRVQEMERYTQSPLAATHIGSEFGGNLVIHDPVVTLATCEGKLWLCVAEVNGLKFKSEPVDQLPISHLSEPSAVVSCQLLGLRPTTQNDDPSQKFDWRTFILPVEKTFSVSGHLIQCVDPDMSIAETLKSYYLFQTHTLLALTTAIHGSLQSRDLKGAPFIQRTKDFPYRESS